MQFLKNLILFSVVFLAACQLFEDIKVKSPEWCKNVSWYQLGLEKGRTGDEDYWLSSEYIQCEGRKFQDEINSGFKVGLGFYCNTDEAMARGSEGKGYNVSLCPEDLAVKIHDSYKSGLTSHCKDAFRGFSIARSGTEKNPCDENNLEYKTAFEAGRTEYIEQEITRYQTKLQLIETEIANVEGHISNLEAQIGQGKWSSAYYQDRNIVQYEEESIRALESVLKDMKYKKNSLEREKQEIQKRLSVLDSKKMRE